MYKSVLFSIALLLCAIFCVSAQDCQVSLGQTDKASWTLNENCYSIVYVSITNNGTSNVNSVTLSSDSNFVAVWDMNETEWGTFVLPDWRAASTITPGQSHIFGYIILSSDDESFNIANVGCAGTSTVAPTEAPTTAPTDAPTAAPTTAPTDAPTAAPTHAATDAPTSAPTHHATQPPTQAPTHHATQPPTQAPTHHATQPPTQAPTQHATQPPTQAPTHHATQAPTTAPTSKPTTAPTSKPTTAPTSKPTTAPTSKPTTAPTNGRLCPAGQIWSPAPLMTWQLQLTGDVNTNPGVQFIDIDMFDNDASTIAALHRNGVAVSCYFSSQYENWRPDSNQFTNDILGNALDDWPGENWVDIRSSKLRSILTARMDIAVQKGCDAIDIDNVDEYQADNGLGLTAADQLDFNKYLAQQAHSRGLSVGLKNDLDQITSLVSYFDWSLNEQCNEYDECDMLTPFVTAGKAVFGVEYDLTVSQFCSKMKTAKFSFLKKTLDLDASGTQCCTSTGGCSGASYTCVTPNARRALYDEEAVSRAARNSDGHHGQQTEAPTRHATQAPTQRATHAPTQAPTHHATQAPTQHATQAPTQRATQAPTQHATQAPTQHATQAPTQHATSAPTSKPTSKATSAPTSGRLCPAGEIWSPAPGMTWQLQLTGTINTNPGVQFIDIDMFDNDASTIAALHRNGVAVSCYFSSQYENWRPDSSQFTSDILGNALDDWPGENWVDIRSSKLRSILTARMDIAVQKGCDAIDIDNVDEYQANNGLGLTAADQLDFNKYLAQQAHSRGLSVGLKNDLDQITSLVSYFDWSLNEQCNEYSECNKLTPFVTAGKAVFGVEYDLSVSQFCPAMKTAKFSFLKKTLDLDASGTQCCTSTGGCTGASYTCVAPSAKRSLYEENLTQAEEPIKEAPTAPKKSAAASLVVPAALVVAAVALAL